MPSTESLEMITKLISCDTTSRYSNMELITYIQDYLTSLDIESTLVPNDDGNKASYTLLLGLRISRAYAFRAY